MKASYNGLWKLLIDKDMKKIDLMRFRSSKRKIRRSQPRRRSLTNRTRDKRTSGWSSDCTEVFLHNFVRKKRINVC